MTMPACISEPKAEPSSRRAMPARSGMCWRRICRRGIRSPQRSFEREKWTERSVPFSAIVFGNLVRFGSLIIRRQIRAFAEKIFFHLFDHELLRIWGTQIQAVLVHHHFQVLSPLLPGVLRNVIVDALAEG